MRFCSLLLQHWRFISGKNNRNGFANISTHFLDNRIRLLPSCRVYDKTQTRADLQCNAVLTLNIISFTTIGVSSYWTFAFDHRKFGEHYFLRQRKNQGCLAIIVGLRFRGIFPSPRLAYHRIGPSLSGISSMEESRLPRYRRLGPFALGEYFLRRDGAYRSGNIISFVDERISKAPRYHRLGQLSENSRLPLSIIVLDPSLSTTEEVRVPESLG